MFVLSAVLPLVFLAGLVAPSRALETGAAGSDTAAPPPPWPDTPATRRMAQDLVDSLNRALLAQPSATATLEHWCGAHGIGAPALVRAEREPAEEGPAPDDVRALLGAGPDTLVRHRRVRLICGAIVLSEADNYYRPDRLTPEMNAILDTTDRPFGKVVSALDFRRSTLEARLLWRPAEEAPATSTTLAIPRYVLTHRAVLTLPDGTPFCALIERYTSGVLAFPPPK